jgi:beta-galactosidase/beta-glucuronidase
MNMNIVRSEGKLEDDYFYDLCDQYGLLVMTDGCAAAPGNIRELGCC